MHKSILTNKIAFKHFPGVLFCLLCMALTLFCCSTVPLAGGGGTEGGNVSGKLVGFDNSQLEHAQVQLITSSYDPVAADQNAAIFTVFTTSDGGYSFVNVPSGSYTIEAISFNRQGRARRGGIVVGNKDFLVPVDTMKKTGAMKIFLPAGINLETGYLYVPGTTLKAMLSGAEGFVIIDSVAPGTIPAIYYATRTVPAIDTMRLSIDVFSGDTAIIAHPECKYARRIVLNTTAGGAGVSSAVSGFPVLVRLDSSNFNFDQAQASGNDLLFTRSDTVPLPYEIERWNLSLQQAEVWVKVDTVYGDNGIQYITMYWGASTTSTGAVTVASNSSAVFDTGNGFQGVWHLGEATGEKAIDATINHFDGTPSGAAPTNAGGVIGAAQSFNGQSNTIRMIGTESSKLNFKQNDYYSLSAWVYSDSLDSTTRSIVSKGPTQYGLQQGNTREWDAYDFLNAVGWIGSRSAASAKTWKYVTCVRNGSAQFLYVNDLLAAAITDSAKSTVARDETNPVAIGMLPEGGRPFKGSIDEVRLSNVAYNADWIKLCYMNQRSDNKLAEFK